MPATTPPADGPRVCFTVREGERAFGRDEGERQAVVYGLLGRPESLIQIRTLAILFHYLSDGVTSGQVRMTLSADFSTQEAAKLARVAPQKLDVWDRTGFLRPSIPAKRRGVSRRYTFRDVIALRVAGELRARGISLQTLRKVVEYLRKRDGLSATDVLASTNLVTDGERVYEVEGNVTIQVPSGQRMMNVTIIPLDQVVAEVQRKARALRRAA